MSLYFDLVINCDLREDTPQAAIDAIRCLTDHSAPVPASPQLRVKWTDQHSEENAWDFFHDVHFLAPDPEQEVISNFSRRHRLTIPLENHREVHRYVLQYCGRWLHDDFFYAHHMPFVYWLATVAHESYIGYYKETELGNEVKDLSVTNRRLNP